MPVRLARGWRTGWLVLVALWPSGCALEPNYLDPDGPRHAADHTLAEPAARPELRVVSYNLEHGREVDTAIAVLGAEPLVGADLILMQEMNPEAVDRIARAHALRYVYYPASIKHGQDWGNAILSRWPLHADHKVLLPHADPYSDTRRIAVGADVDLGEIRLRVYSTHIATPPLGLGARLEQVETILEDAASAGAVVLGGDFNTSDPGSEDQVLDLAAGHGFTWASDQARDTSRRWGLDFTLDYVFARGLLAGASGTVSGEVGSDHRPIWVELRTP